MASANLDYLRRCDSFTVGPFMFARFETNPNEHPDTRLCWSSRRGYYLVGIVNECFWEQDPAEVSKPLVVVSDIWGRVLLMNEFASLEQAERAMLRSRETGSSSESDYRPTREGLNTRRTATQDHRDEKMERGGGSEDARELLTRYKGKVYRVVFGPPCFVEQRNGALLGTGMPSIELADPETGVPLHGLTFDIPEAPLRPGQVLVGGREEGLQALTEAGVVRFTGAYYRSKRFLATFAVCDLLVGPFRRRTPTALR